MEHLDLETIIIERLQNQMGKLGDLFPESSLVNDLGLDSVGLVIILLDLAEEFNLDLGSLNVTLGKLHTVSDVVCLVETLHSESAGG